MGRREEGVRPGSRQSVLAVFIFSLVSFGTAGVWVSRIDLPSWDIVLYRSGIGGAFILLVFLLTRQKPAGPAHRKDLGIVFLSGMAQGVSWIFLHTAYQEIGAGLGTIAYYCGPIAVMFLSPLLFREKMTWWKAGTFLAVVFGMILVNLEALESGKTQYGIFAGLMSAVFLAVMLILYKKARHIGGFEGSLIQIAGCFTVVFLFVLSKEGLPRPVPGGSLPWMLILALFNTGIAWCAYYGAVAKLPVQTVSILGYLEPLSAVIWGALVLGESMSGLQAAGALLILGGAVLSEVLPAILGWRHRSGVRER